LPGVLIHELLVDGELKLILTDLLTILAICFSAIAILTAIKVGENFNNNYGSGGNLPCSAK
jgi:hypothetical protein